MSVFSLEPVTDENTNEIAAFLASGEQSCVSLLEHFVSNSGLSLVKPPSTNCYRAVYITESGNIKQLYGVLGITAGGLLLHHFPYAQKLTGDAIEEEQAAEKILQLKALFVPFLQPYSLFCIMGATEMSLFFLQWYARQPRCNRAYILMEYSQEGGKRYACACSPLPHGFTLRRCSEDDAEALYSLQKEYEFEEVLPPGEPFSSFSCRTSLRKSLQTQYVYALFYGTQAVAKAGTNAQGIRYDQLGGVFTAQEWRNKGFAKMLVHHAAENVALRGKKTVLFVKKENEPAKHAYHSVGFSDIADFSIIYF